VSAVSALKKIKIIGGGVSGLFAAYNLKKLGHDVEIYEKSNRVGGLIQTLHLDWGVVETAANGVLNSRKLQLLAQDINLELVPAQKKFKKRYIFRDKPRQLPLTFFESWNLLKRVFSKIEPDPRETLKDFSVRVYGEAAAKYLVEPAVLGVFGAPPEELSGTLVYKYFFKGPRDPVAEKSQRGTVAPVRGMSGLVEALYNWLLENGVKIHLSSAIEKLEKSSDEIIIVATDARVAGQLLENIDSNTASLLKMIEYRPLSSVTVSYDKPTPLKGFGCLFPRDQGFNAFGVLFNTCIFANRGPDATETWILPDGKSSSDELIEKVKADSQRLYKKAFTIKNSVITVWPRALPLYNTQLEVDLKLMSLPRGFYLTGNYLGQIGLSKIFEGSHHLAQRIHKEA
jgi:oxygen-dependent protoporphyrinogen oxidase